MSRGTSIYACRVRKRKDKNMLDRRRVSLKHNQLINNPIDEENKSTRRKKLDFLFYLRKNKDQLVEIQKRKTVFFVKLGFLYMCVWFIFEREKQTKTKRKREMDVSDEIKETTNGWESNKILLVNDAQQEQQHDE